MNIFIYTEIDRERERASLRLSRNQVIIKGAGVQPILQQNLRLTFDILLCVDTCLFTHIYIHMYTFVLVCRRHVYIYKHVFNMCVYLCVLL